EMHRIVRAERSQARALVFGDHVIGWCQQALGGAGARKVVQDAAKRRDLSHLSPPISFAYRSPIAHNNDGSSAPARITSSPPPSLTRTTVEGMPRQGAPSTSATPSPK